MLRWCIRSKEFFFTFSGNYNVATSGYVTLPSNHRRGLQRSQSTVSSGSHHSATAANITQVLTSKPRFGGEYVSCQALRVSQSTGDGGGGASSSGAPGSPLSTTPAMAMPIRPACAGFDHFGGGGGGGYGNVGVGGSRRHYVNFTPCMAGLIPTPNSRSQVAAMTGYVNLDMRSDSEADVYAQVDMRPGHSAPECPTGGTSRLNYAKLQFNDDSCGLGGGSQTSINAIDGSGGSPSTSCQTQPRLVSRSNPHRLSSSAEHSFSRSSMSNRDPQCDYIELDTTRTKVLSKIVCEQQAGTDQLEEGPTEEQTPSNESLSGSQSALAEASNSNSNSAQVVPVQPDHHNQQSAPPNGSTNTSSSVSATGSNGNGAIPLRNPSFPKKLRSFRFSTRKNSEPNSWYNEKVRISPPFCAV